MNYATLISNTFCCSLTPLERWLTFGKLPENPVVTPTSTVQVVTPSGVNRYLQSVTVNAVTTPSGT
jgi:hypothetical protein